MPAYYETNQAITTSGSASTEQDQLRGLTGSTASVKLMTLSGASRFGTAGGAILRVKTFATASTVGTTISPLPKRNPNSVAGTSTWATLPTAGSTPTVRLSVGVAQTGGMGGWVAWELAAAIALLAGGGANGNLDIFSIANASSVTLDFTMEIIEALDN